ncbi:MAG: RNA 2'-phosphotransferase [Planctomycetes bacterium]|nr:RNA 2'-phosphotransferase [Planctomycetota bacterium]
MNEKERRTRSKLLSYVLRHHPGDFGLTLDEGGWIEIDVLLDALRRRQRALSREQLEEIVATNPKRRFEFDESGQHIRARQGHSTPIDLGYEPRTPPEYLYHGTATRNLESILASGLLRGARHAVHLADERGIAMTLEVAARHGRPVLIRVRALDMHAAGHVFHRTGNDVWLTEHVPPTFLEACPEHLA